MKIFVAKIKQNKQRSIVIASGALLVCVALGLVADNYFGKANWVDVTGTVKNYTLSSNTRRTTYRTEIEYTVNNQSYTTYETETTQPSIGAPRFLSYNPQHPDQSTVQHESQYVIAAMLAGLGLILVVGGMLVKMTPQQ